MMLLHPRAPKIRHLNSSHSLLIELEKHVKKVQELESKVYEMEMQLQLKELVVRQALQAEQKAADGEDEVAMVKDTQAVCAIRLEQAKRKTEEMYSKRAEEEANILRAWHMKRLGSAIDRLSKIPESDVVFLPEQTEVTEKDLKVTNHILSGLDDLVNLANPTDEVADLKVLLEERENLRKHIEDIETKMEQAKVTVEECKNALYDVRTARTKVGTKLNMSKTLLDAMQDMEQKRKNRDMFIFGPNPIFSSTREIELNYSMSNQFVIEMLQELDITHIVAEKNLDSALEVEMKFKKNRIQLDEGLEQLQDAIDMQIHMVNNVKPDLEEVKVKKEDTDVHRPQEAEKI